MQEKVPGRGAVWEGGKARDELTKVVQELSLRKEEKGGDGKM